MFLKSAILPQTLLKTNYQLFLSICFLLFVFNIYNFIVIYIVLTAIHYKCKFFIFSAIDNAKKHLRKPIAI